ncbi:hypothetical protein [Legionella resiliens]|uniref:Uncharacterized protein n=1 Tax=Legionella resiliens TaxID=2905958 RepID=A0ABS8X760_9GAMM|nr:MULTISPECIES: hypothetical protein [unclassified Legionella]MCE0723766.1 hypothetical protein [Legionella sp. 9fVS26]MCE3532918.1 hypothetical protein [Legionella sp. 8cVS16]
MFSFLKSKKNNGITPTASNSTPNLDTPDLQEKKSPETGKDTWVFIWNMTSEKVGHAAIQVGGSKPKMKNEDPGEYASIHPDKIPSTGLTSVLPLPAHIATNLSEDMQTLGAAAPISVTDIGEPIKIIPKDTGPLPPDHVYHYKNLNASEMHKHIEQAHKKVKTGKMGYQLFPNVNLLGLLKDSSAFIAQDPIDIEMHRRASEKKTNNHEVHNCTSFVTETLNKGGLPVKSSKTKPWGVTPNGLSDEMENNMPKI